VGGVAGTDRASDRPRSPSGRVVGPFGDIEVEGPRGGEFAATVQPWPGHGDPLLVGAGPGAGTGQHPLLPRRGDIARKLQRVDAGMVGLEIGPEEFAEQVGQPLQRGEIHRRLPFEQVVDQHVPHRAAGDPVAVDQWLSKLQPKIDPHRHQRRGVYATSRQTSASRPIVSGTHRRRMRYLAGQGNLG